MQAFNSSAKRAGRTPLIYQGESSECGLACLAMIAGAWGMDADITSIRTRLGATPQGINLRTLIGLAAKIGLGGRAVRIGLRRLHEVRVPAILHWGMDHFVVLEQVRSGMVSILDPARGRLVVSLEDISPEFTGVAVELTPNDTFRKQSIRLPRAFRLSWINDKSFRSTAIAALSFTLIFQAAALSLPFIFRRVMDGASLKLESDYAMLIVAGLSLLILVQAASAVARGITVGNLGNILVHRVSLSIVTHLFSLPVSYFRQRMTGGILARVQSIESLRRFVTDQAIPMLVDAFVAVTALGLMLWFDAKLGAIILVGILADIAIRIALSSRERVLTTGAVEAQSKELSSLLESVRAIQAIKLAGREPHRVSIWENKFVETMRFNSKLNVLRTLVSSASGLIVSIEWGVILLIASLELPKGLLTAGSLFGILAYRGIVRERIGSILSTTSSLYLVSANLQRIDDLMLSTPETISGKVPSASLPVSIKFSDVSFRYDLHGDEVLEHAFLEVPRGGFVAIVGLSGAGKTTLAKLLLGLEKPDSGTIFVDDYDLSQCDARQWRQLFGSVMQDDSLLWGTMAENISFFDDNIDMAKVQRCARAAAIDLDIEALPMGYGSLVGDGGANLSGGQKQRILIARALYREPKAIVFDEGTANIDSMSEKLIADALSSMNITRVIIAHRSELVDLADSVYELKNKTLVKIR